MNVLDLFTDVRSISQKPQSRNSSELISWWMDKAAWPMYTMECCLAALNYRVMLHVNKHLKPGNRIRKHMYDISRYIIPPVYQIWNRRFHTNKHWWLRAEPKEGMKTDCYWVWFRQVMKCSGIRQWWLLQAPRTDLKSMGLYNRRSNFVSCTLHQIKLS